MGAAHRSLAGYVRRVIGDDATRTEIRLGSAPALGAKPSAITTVVPLLGRRPAWMRQLPLGGGVDHALVRCGDRWYLVDTGVELTDAGLPVVGEVDPTQVHDLRRGPWCTRFTLLGERYWVYRGFRQDLELFIDGT